MKLPNMVLILLLSLSSVGFGQCKKIVVESKVTNTTDGLNNGKIVLDIDDSKEKFSISLFGQRAQNKMDVKSTELNDLSKGKYLIVIVGKKEDDNYCPKSIEVTIN